jgi:hypothetical protein
VNRYEVYFLQKKQDATWETLERAQISSVLVSSLSRIAAEDTAEVRLVAGAWDAEAEEWHYEQIFYLDGRALDVAVGTPGEMSAAPINPLLEEEDDVRMPLGGPFDQSAERDGHDDPFGTAPTEPEQETEQAADQAEDDADQRDDFAAAIRRARGADEDRQDEDAVEHDLEPGAPNLDDPFAPASRDRSADEDEDDTGDRLSNLGFARRRPVDDEDDEGESDFDVGPPPAFVRPQRRNGRAAMMIGILLLALVFIAIGGVALMVALDRPEIRPYQQMLENYIGEMMGESHDGQTMTEPKPVMPITRGDAVTFAGVAEDLQGRWSPNNCELNYVEFSADGYVIGTMNKPLSVKIPVTETMVDDYTFFVRRSPIMVEHYQRLGRDEIQLIGRTTTVGFETQTSDILNRC